MSMRKNRQNLREGPIHSSGICMVYHRNGLWEAFPSIIYGVEVSQLCLKNDWSLREHYVCDGLILYAGFLTCAFLYTIWRIKLICTLLVVSVFDFSTLKHPIPHLPLNTNCVGLNSMVCVYTEQHTCQYSPAGAHAYTHGFL